MKNASLDGWKNDNVARSGMLEIYDFSFSAWEFSPTVATCLLKINCPKFPRMAWAVKKTIQKIQFPSMMEKTYFGYFFYKWQDKKGHFKITKMQKLPASEFCTKINKLCNFQFLSLTKISGIE